MNIIEELRNKKSRDNRDLLDRAANEIERLQAELDEITSKNKALAFSDKSDKSVALLKRDGTFKVLYKSIDTIEDCELLAQLAMTHKGARDLIIIFPGANRSIDRDERALYEKALALEKKYTDAPEDQDEDPPIYGDE